jgi:oxygen-independent coproporphyrinogen-3 oxidase
MESLRHLEDAGFEQYEISNFALPGFQCRHNLKYWERLPVLGFGVGSHSFDGKRRYANASKLDTYLDRVESEGSAVEWERSLREGEDLQESLFLRLRLKKGIDWETLRSDFGARSVSPYEAVIRSMCDSGLVDWQSSRVTLTARGMLLSNEVFREFV